MTDIFAHSKIRLSQAKKHIIAFEGRIKAFFKEEQYMEVTEHESKGKWVRKIKFTKPFIDDLAAIATDVVDNLRASLDYAWHSLAVASGAIVFTDEAKFLFADSASKFEKAVKKGFKKFRPEIVALLRTFQPYKGGNDLLWALNRIAATDRHKILAPVILMAGNLRGSVAVSTGEVTFPPAGWNHAKNEIIAFSVTTNGRTPFIDPNLKLPLGVVFDQVEVVSNQRAITVLNNLAGEVENILEALEGAARVLGLIA
jgi:hypothetical protein